jgi:hypothetical protein
MAVLRHFVFLRVFSHSFATTKRETNSRKKFAGMYLKYPEPIHLTPAGSTNPPFVLQGVKKKHVWNTPVSVETGDFICASFKR